MVLFVSKWHHASEGTFYEQNLSKLLNLVFIRETVLQISPQQSLFL